jgi:hypothetical protein
LGQQREDKTMGQQQLLLIVLGVIIVGLAVAAAVTLMNSQSSASNRDAVTNDLLNLSTRAQQYYRRPRMLGGGGHSFSGLTMTKITTKTSNPNGTYSLSPDPVAGTPAYIELVGIGVETGNDGSAPVKVVMKVWPDSAAMDVTHTN